MLKEAPKMRRTNGRAFVAPTLAFTASHMVGQSTDPEASATSSCKSNKGVPPSWRFSITNLKGTIARLTRTP